MKSLDTVVERMHEVLAKRADDTGVFQHVYESDPIYASEFVDAIELAIVDLSANTKMFEISVKGFSARPGRIIYDASTNELTARSPSPIGAPNRLKYVYKQTYLASHLIYNELNKT